MSDGLVLCLVTDRSAVRGDLVKCVFEAVRAGVDRVQIRERELDGTALFDHAAALADAARRAAAERGGAVEIVINRRVDVALAIGGCGVHLGFDAMSPVDARRLLGDGAPIGISAHSVEEIAAAPPEVDYAHLAPIFDPLSKSSSRRPLGPAAITRATTRGLPIIAQGGITPENAPSLIAAGATGIAVTHTILTSTNPSKSTTSLKNSLLLTPRTSPNPRTVV